MPADFRAQSATCGPLWAERHFLWGVDWFIGQIGGLRRVAPKTCTSQEGKSERVESLCAGGFVGPDTRINHNV